MFPPVPPLSLSDHVAQAVMAYNSLTVAGASFTVDGQSVDVIPGSIILIYTDEKGVKRDCEYFLNYDIKLIFS